MKIKKRKCVNQLTYYVSFHFSFFYLCFFFSLFSTSDFSTSSTNVIIPITQHPVSSSSQISLTPNPKWYFRCVHSVLFKNIFYNDEKCITLEKKQFPRQLKQLSMLDCENLIIDVRAYEIESLFYRSLFSSFKMCVLYDHCTLKRLHLHNIPPESLHSCLIGHDSLQELDVCLAVNRPNETYDQLEQLIPVQCLGHLQKLAISSSSTGYSLKEFVIYSSSLASTFSSVLICLRLKNIRKVLISDYIASTLQELEFDNVFNLDFEEENTIFSKLKKLTLYNCSSMFLATRFYNKTNELNELFLFSISIQDCLQLDNFNSLNRLVITIYENYDGNRVCLNGGKELQHLDVRVPIRHCEFLLIENMPKLKSLSCIVLDGKLNKNSERKIFPMLNFTLQLTNLNPSFFIRTSISVESQRFLEVISSNINSALSAYVSELVQRDKINKIEEFYHSLERAQSQIESLFQTNQKDLNLILYILSITDRDNLQKMKEETTSPQDLLDYANILNFPSLKELENKEMEFKNNLNVFCGEEYKVLKEELKVQMKACEYHLKGLETAYKHLSNQFTRYSNLPIMNSLISSSPNKDISLELSSVASLKHEIESQIQLAHPLHLRAQLMHVQNHAYTALYDNFKSYTHSVHIFYHNCMESITVLRNEFWNPLKKSFVEIQHFYETTQEIKHNAVNNWNICFEQYQRKYQFNLKELIDDGWRYCRKLACIRQMSMRCIEPIYERINEHIESVQDIQLKLEKMSHLIQEKKEHIRKERKQQ